jgi:hypothetical protein
MKKLSISFVTCALVIFAALLAQMPGGATTASALSLGEGKTLAGIGKGGSSQTEAVAAQVGPAFTYQGQLKDGGQPANGQYDFRFTLFDASEGNGQIGSSIMAGTWDVTDGLFTVTLSFGPNAFNGDARYLQIEVQLAGGSSFTVLSPRQPITPAPYALFALFAQKTQGYKNVVTVAGAGGDFTSIQAALNSITDNNATNRYLLWVGPGTYTERVTMKPYVDIEGAGEGNTIITLAGGGNPNTGTVIGASNAELRFLTVQSLTGLDAIAIYTQGQSPRITHVTATASGSISTIAIYMTSSSSPRLTDVTATATSDGTAGGTAHAIFSSVSSPIMNNVTVTVSGAANSNTALATNGTGTVRLEHSTLISSGNNNHTAGNSGSVTQIASSRMDGGSVQNTSGTLTCAGVYNGSFTFFANTCP